VTLGDDGHGRSTSHADKATAQVQRHAARYDGPGGGLPFPMPTYNDFAAALAQGMNIAVVGVNVRSAHGMSIKSLRRLATKLAGLDRVVSGRHGAHRNQRQKITGEHMNFLLARMRQTGSQATSRSRCILT
jgi:hypothetical protein